MARVMRGRAARTYERTEISRLIVEGRRAGKSYDDIAAELTRRYGRPFSRANVSGIFSHRLREIREALKDELQEYLLVQLERLEDMYAHAYVHAMTVVAEDGSVERVPDPIQQDICLRIIDRITRLLGLDKTPTVNVQTEQTLNQLVLQSIASAPPVITAHDADGSVTVSG